MTNELQKRAISLDYIRNALDQYFNPSLYASTYDDEYGEEDDYPPYTQIQNLMLGEDGNVFCVYRTEGIYYMADISLSDGMIELSNMQEVFRENNQIRIILSPNGKYRWFGTIGTATLNRIGVFDSKDLFDSFEKNFNPSNPPYYTLVHAGESLRIGNVDWIGRYENTLLGSGEFDDTELATRAKEAIENFPNYFGNSVGFLSNKETLTKSRDNKIRAMYKEGELIEVSLLPEKYAAHYFTNIFTIEKEENRMSLSTDALKETLSKMGYDETAIDKLINGVKETNNRIVAENMEVRVKKEETTMEKEEEKVEEVEQEKVEDTKVQVTEERVNEKAQADMTQFELELTDEDLKSIAEPIEANFTARMNEMQASFETRLNELKSFYETELAKIQNRIKGIADDDQERIQEIVQDLPRKSKPTLTFRPRSLVDDKNPDGSVLPDTTKAGWASELAKQNVQKTKIAQ